MYGVSQSRYIHSFVNPGHSTSYSYYNQQQPDAYASGGPQPASLDQFAMGSVEGSRGAVIQENAYSFPGNAFYSQPASPNQCSNAGKPPHVVVAFGFGGTIALIRPSSQSLEIRNMSSLMEPATGLDLHEIDRRSKTEIFKWIDERISNCAYEEMDSRNHQALPLVWEALKIAYEHHGKLRSGLHFQGNGPGIAMSQLILRTRGTVSNSCFQKTHIEESTQATATKVNGLLLSGKTQQALQCAEEGQAWELALSVAARIGDKCYADTVSKMAHYQLTPGPAGNSCPDGVSSGELSNNAESTQSTDNWHEHLAVMATSRTLGDEGVITSLGDAIWSQKDEVAAAHLCYLLVDQSEVFFSDGRIRLIGADHWKCPRTFVTPLAIKRTEIYEHVKTKGNPPFALAWILPYKLIYANMLAENGQREEALRYCRSLLQALTNARFNLELCRQNATDLEARLVHSLEDGKGTYGKLAGRILSNTFNYVKSSLPAANITRFNSSASIASQEVESHSNKAPERSVSEPDLSKHEDTNAAKPGFLRRVGSNVFQKTASFVGRSKQEDNHCEIDGENPIITTVAPEQYLNCPRPQAQQKTTGLYVQCSDYYSRCMNSFSKDGGSQLVRSLISPQLPPILKFRKSQAPQRVLEV